MAVVIVVSLLPLRVGYSGTPRSASVLAMARRTHVIAHIFAFGVPAFVFSMFLRRPARRLLCVCGLAGLGLLIEYCQHVIYHNPLETWDVRDDFLAVLGGYLLATLFRMLVSWRARQ